MCFKGFAIADLPRFESGTSTNHSSTCWRPGPNPSAAGPYPAKNSPTLPPTRSGVSMTVQSGLQAMKLQELKTKKPNELLEFAEDLEVENASSMRKQDMMF